MTYRLGQAKSDTLYLVRRFRVVPSGSGLLTDIYRGLPGLLRTKHGLLSLATGHRLELQSGEDVLQVLTRYLLDVDTGDVCRCEFLKTLRPLVEYL